VTFLGYLKVRLLGLYAIVILFIAYTNVVLATIICFNFIGRKAKGPTGASRAYRTRPSPRRNFGPGIISNTATFLAGDRNRTRRDYDSGIARCPTGLTLYIPVVGTRTKSRTINVNNLSCFIMVHILRLVTTIISGGPNGSLLTVSIYETRWREYRINKQYG